MLLASCSEFSDQQITTADRRPEGHRMERRAVQGGELARSPLCLVHWALRLTRAMQERKAKIPATRGLVAFYIPFIFIVYSLALPLGANERPKGSRGDTGGMRLCAQIPSAHKQQGLKAARHKKRAKVCGAKRFIKARHVPNLQ